MNDRDFFIGVILRFRGSELLSVSHRFDVIFYRHCH